MASFSSPRARRPCGAFLAAVLAGWGTGLHAGELPADPSRLRRSASHAEVAAFLHSLPSASGDLRITVSELSRSAQGRSIALVHLRRQGAPAAVRALVHAQQHGDEVSGKDALLFLLRDFVATPASFPQDLDLWLIPMLNPDGAENGRRGNGAGVDLNRDHLLLSQPETRALHALVRRVRPHLLVDCHEFARDSRDYLERGWGEWPHIMMDTANHPFLADGLYEAGLRWVHEAAVTMAKNGIAYQRYLVGDAPHSGNCVRPPWMRTMHATAWHSTAGCHSSSKWG